MKIAVVHPYVSVKGGAEVVCASVLKFLVMNGGCCTLFTCDSADQAKGALFELTEMSFDDLEVVTVSSALLWLLALKKPAALIGYALCHRLLRKRIARGGDGFEAIVSTYGELDVATDVPAFCFVHYPIFLPRESARIGGRLTRFPFVRRLYTQAARRLAEFSAIAPQTVVLTNSEWTRAEIERAGCLSQIEVIYCPVKGFPRGACRAEWMAVGAQRPDGRVKVASLGRLVGYKGHGELVAALRMVHAETGQRFDLLFAGRGNEADVAEIERLSCDAVAVQVLLNGSRDEIGAALGDVHFGVSAFQFEHFGIAVAELMATGVQMFVPRGGGQVEIVCDERFIFSDWDDFVGKVVNELASGALFVQLEDPDQLGRFSEARFHQRLSSALGFAVVC